MPVKRRNLFVMLDDVEHALLHQLVKRDALTIREVVTRAIRMYAGQPTTNLESRVARLEAILLTEDGRE